MSLAFMSLPSMEELIREPGESGSAAGRLEATRFIVAVVAEGD
jgi:hypothetical protein